MAKPIYTLLIVEDILIQREQFRESLLTDSSCDYQIMEAASVAAGLALCAPATPTSNIDLILLDYSLPDGDGLGFLTKLQAVKGSGHMPPVVMVTGRGDESIATRAMKLGADDYLAKFNLTTERLLAVVHSTIEAARLRLQLQHSNELLRVSLDTMLDCFGIYSAIRDATGEIIDFRFEYLNPAALESNQMTAADMSRGLCEVFPAQCEKGLFEQYCELVATGVPLILDNLIYTDVFGTQQLTKAYDVRISKSNDGFVAAWRDVTVQKQAEQERDCLRQTKGQRFFDLLQASEWKFSAIFDQTFELIGLLSMEGIVLEVNNTALASISACKSEIVGKWFWETPWWHTKQLQQQVQAAILTAASGQLVCYEMQFTSTDGATKTIDFSFKPVFNESAQVVTIVVEGHDITDLKQIQAALVERNHDLDSFVYIVSHDLKAPLRAVSNLAQWIEDDLEGELPAATQAQMVLLRSRVERMSLTIDGLLDYARIGRIEQKIESVSVIQLVAAVIDELDPPPTFTISIAPDLPTLFTNQLLLFQVFSNLIGNAIKHHHRVDGVIEISCQTYGDFYEFAIADDGAGIPLEYQDKVFNIFQAVNPQNRSDSTGIGLAIVKKIIEAKGGSIRLESNIGQGTTFYFTWPTRDSQS